MKKNYESVLNQVLKQVKPSTAEKKKLEGLAKKVLEETKKEAKKYKATAILAGSITRNTWLPGKMEFDVFVLFPVGITIEQLEKHGLKIGKSVITKLKGKHRVEYAQHPYICGTVQGADIDIVPCYELKTPEKLKSAVDRTPFHVKYIEKKLPAKLSDDVRLLKQFCKTNEIYGADAKTEGFSGYVCELLLIKYGSFLNVIKNVVKWLPGEIIDIESHHKKEDYPKLRKQFKEQVLIIFDPTDKNRNAAAAISARSFLKMKKVSKQFLQKPSPKLFEEFISKPITEHELIMNQMKRRMELILVKFKSPDVVPDILWPQLRRFSNRLQSILEETKYEFKVFGKSEYSNEKDLAVVLLEMEFSKLPTIQKRIGPKVFDIKDSERFLEKYKQAPTGPYVENNCWVVETPRKFLAARAKVQDVLKDSIKILKDKGIPNYIADEISKGYEIISENTSIIHLVKKDPTFGIFLRKYFDKESLS